MMNIVCKAMAETLWRGVRFAAVAGVLMVMSGVPARTGEVPGAVALGGRLYDNWILELRYKPPQVRHPLYPAGGKLTGTPAETWRCTTCHGWDYKGKDGAYGKTSDRYTGIAGLWALRGTDPAKIAAVLNAPAHGYDDIFYDDQINALAAFVSQGQVEMNDSIDPATGQARGDKTTQVEFYMTVCSNCHGANGTETRDIPPVGFLARHSPYETLHKLLVGHPGTKMPAIGVLGQARITDLLAFLQTLPERADDTAPPVRDVLAAVVRGGRLYDNWILETHATAPKGFHPAYPATQTTGVQAEMTWRCGGCHGWDYRGTEGQARAITPSVIAKSLRAGLPVEDVLTILGDSNHRYNGILNARDQFDLATFINKGLVDLDSFIDGAVAKGDPVRYKHYYEAICAPCHGFDGRKITNAPPLGHMTRQNPWHAVHMVLNGHPDELMPPMRVLEKQIVIDLVAHLQTLPADR
ncbi:MAG: hypothetical protein FD149_39 [Rhodospirillaceae bacterium]|nr:MAG: hypothetical protein FD149_39 [Rhodospirillaceae bacterium]